MRPPPAGVIARTLWYGDLLYCEESTHLPGPFNVTSMREPCSCREPVVRVPFMETLLCPPVAGIKTSASKPEGRSMVAVKPSEVL